MLQSIHDKAKGILGIIIVIFIALVFGLWGIGDYLAGPTEKFVAKVDDIQISQSEFDQGLARQRQRVEQMFQGKLPDSPVFEQQLKNQTLEQLITQRVLQKMVAEEGYRVSDQILAQKIKSMSAFQQDGVFAADTYQSIVESQGMAVKEFENLFRNDLAVQQLQDAVMRSSIIGKAELDLLNKIQNQSRKVSYLLFTDEDYFNEVTVTDDEIAEYFDANQQMFMNPETVRIAYVELSENDLVKDIPVDEEAVERLYDEYVASQQGKEQRKARHILIDVAADAGSQALEEARQSAENILAKIKQGESFEKLAAEFSKDPGSANNGGDLGWVAKGMMVPEFEQALFKLQKNQVSELIKSSFGFHIIRLDDVRAEDIDSFASKKAELVKRYRAQKLEDRFYEQSELMATTAYENDQSLQAVADALGLQIKVSEAFSRDQGKGIAENDKVRNAAFDTSVLAENRNSDIIELGNNHAMVLRIDSHTAASPKKLDEVKSVIAARLKLEKASEKSKADALQSLAKLENGESIDSAAVKQSAQLIKLGDIKRDNTALDSALLRGVFGMPKPVNHQPVFDVVELTSGTAVIQLSDVTEPAEASKQALQQMSQQLQNEQATREMAAVLEFLKSRTTIVRNENL